MKCPEKISELKIALNLKCCDYVRYLANDNSELSIAVNPQTSNTQMFPKTLSHRELFSIQINELEAAVIW